MTFNGSFLSILVLAAAAPALFAATISEAEANGTSVNSTRTTAQILPGSAFTLPVPATVYSSPAYTTATILGQSGINDVDFYSFFSYAGPAYFDIDNTPATFDSIISLFNSAGTLLAYSDDSPLDPGSVNTIDAFLGVVELPVAGTYYIAVSRNPNFATTALTGTETALTRPDGLAGGYSVTNVTAGVSTFDFSGPQQAGNAYTLHASVQAVPEPASFVLIGTGLLAVGFAARRKLRG